MDPLREAACIYQTLLGKNYHVEAGYRDERIGFTFLFLPEHFYHLVGFHKLLDRKAITKPRLLYEKVLAGEITYASVVAGSRFREETEGRMASFVRLRDIVERLSCGKIIIEFSQKNRTRIRADFLLFDCQDNVYAHLFLRKDARYGYIPCSFFCREDDKYLRNNKKYRVIQFSITT